MKKRILIVGIILSAFLLTGCEEDSKNIQERQNIIDDGVTITYSYTDIRGDSIVNELLEKIKMPKGSKDEDLFYKNKKLTYQDIPNKDMLLLGARNYKTKNPEAISMTADEMKKEIQSIFTDEVKIKQKEVTDGACSEVNLTLKGMTYTLVSDCTDSNGFYVEQVLTADDADGKAIEISTKVAYVETNENERIIYKEKNGTEIRREDANKELNLLKTTGLIIVKYTFVKYKGQYYFYSSEKIG